MPIRKNFSRLLLDARRLRLLLLGLSAAMLIAGCGDDGGGY
jgi:hypothetical protein